MSEESRILVVDDDAAIRRVLQRSLRGWGYRCETAADGRAALDKLAGSDFDVAMIDLQMPRMDGLSLPRTPGAPTTSAASSSVS